MYAGGGKLMDVVGTRAGLLAIMVFWSLACASHGLATSVGMLAVSRLLLGMGEGGGFPAATRAVAEWFPVTERSTAMGIINAGTAVGGVVAPPLLALVITTADWRTVFYLAAAIGLAWSVWWWFAYYPPDRHPRLSEDERRLLAPVIGAGQTADPAPPWLTLLQYRETLGPGRRQVPERRGLVFLPVLAAEIPLRRARVRHQGGRRVRLDSLRGGRHRLPDGRLALELSPDAQPAARSGPQDRARAERGGDACRVVRAERAGRLGARHLQPRLFRPAVVVDAGDDPADRPLPAQRRRRRRRDGRLRRRDGRRRIRPGRRPPARQRLRLRRRLRHRRARCTSSPSPSSAWRFPSCAPSPRRSPAPVPRPA